MRSPSIYYPSMYYPSVHCPSLYPPRLYCPSMYYPSTCYPSIRLGSATFFSAVPLGALSKNKARDPGLCLNKRRRQRNPKRPMASWQPALKEPLQAHYIFEVACMMILMIIDGFVSLGRMLRVQDHDDFHVYNLHTRATSGNMRYAHCTGKPTQKKTGVITRG